MILAGIATHMTSRKSIARQSAAAAEAPQTAIMNKVMLYLFPLGVVAGGPFFPLAILIYWLSNNTWTFGQLFVAHRIQDRQKAELASVVEAEVQAASFTKPRPGAKPLDPKRPLITPVSLDKAGPVVNGWHQRFDQRRTARRPTVRRRTASSRRRRPAPGARPAGCTTRRPGQEEDP